MNNLFKTDVLSLAPYLLNEHLQYLGCEIGQGKNNQKKVIFIFSDPKNIGKDLERAFLNSREKSYRDSMHYFRSQINKALNGQIKLYSSDKGQD